MCVRTTRDETMNEQNNDKSIDRLWWWCGFYFFFASTLLLVTLHILCARAYRLKLVKPKKKSMPYAPNDARPLIIRLGFCFFKLHSFHLLCTVMFSALSALPNSWWPSCGHYKEKLSFNKLQSMISACNIRTVLIVYVYVLEWRSLDDACGLIWFINTSTSIFNLVIPKWKSKCCKLIANTIFVLFYFLFFYHSQSPQFQSTIWLVSMIAHLSNAHTI